MESCRVARLSFQRLLLVSSRLKGIRKGEGPLFGSRQIMVRFQGCPLNCVYCNAPDIKRSETCKLEATPGLRNWKPVNNPIELSELERHIKGLTTPDLHSINFTGGEPLDQLEFCIELAKAVHKFQGIVYLDTAGYPYENFKKLVDYCEYVKIDIKSADAGAVVSEKFDRLVNEELESIKLSVKKQKPTIAKIVIMETTDKKWFENVLSQLKVEVNSVTFFNLTLTPVSPTEEIKNSPSLRKLFEFSEIASKYVPADFIQVTPQAEGYYGVPTS